MYLFGVVKFFNPVRQYGFLKWKGQEIFFHFNNGGSVDEGVQEPIISVLRRPNRFPVKDDIIAFKLAPGRKGEKASPWALGDEFARVLEDMVAAKEAQQARFRAAQQEARARADRAMRDFEAEFRNRFVRTPPLDHRVQAVINLIHRGTTPGERDAARAAYKRLTGKDYRTV